VIMSGVFVCLKERDAGPYFKCWCLGMGWMDGLVFMHKWAIQETSIGLGRYNIIFCLMTFRLCDGYKVEFWE